MQWYKRHKKWLAQVGIKGQKRYLGYFEDKEAATEAVRRFREKEGFTPRHGSAP